jgi:hypothetical protein
MLSPLLASYVVAPGILLVVARTWPEEQGEFYEVTRHGLFKGGPDLYKIQWVMRVS